ncbi:hypothetical protein DPMN_123265 [Dreissena polymorpha]|uniref:Uncharacterized protein n=1 Tax=Dreissena polymorpha TaxID=45954 RepID=A0A9D4GU43_DREPO|nr:hypothetical protein DPMN_123265 [Dreissena polymorpha]
MLREDNGQYEVYLDGIATPFDVNKCGKHGCHRRLLEVAGEKWFMCEQCRGYNVPESHTSPLDCEQYEQLFAGESSEVLIPTRTPRDTADSMCWVNEYTTGFEMLRAPLEEKREKLRGERHDALFREPLEHPTVAYFVLHRKGRYPSLDAYCNSELLLQLVLEACDPDNCCHHQNYVDATG